MEQKVKPVLVIFFAWAPYTSLCLDGRTSEVRTIKLEEVLGQELLKERLSMGEDADGAIRDELLRAHLETLRVVQGFAASDEIASYTVAGHQIAPGPQMPIVLGNWLSHYGNPTLQSELNKALEEMGKIVAENMVSGVFPWRTVWPPDPS